jgi:hypothetical protein
MDTSYKNYLIDLVVLLKEKLQNSYDDMQNSKGEDRVFLQGEVNGYYTTIDLIKSQAIAFGIPLSELSLFEYDLEKFLQ